MNPNQPLTLLGGLTPAQFMKTYWQRKPLLIRQAFPGFKPPLSATTLKKMSRRDDVESRLVWREKSQWQLDRGPFTRLPKSSTPDWSLLVQSVDIHDDAASALMNKFRFVPDARLDDLMISLATEGGGVGPHFDSYDVFLLQGQGRRRWQISQQDDLTLIPDLSLKILKNFSPEEEFVLEPGDMLYLPPQAAHDGVALDNDCMTISIGFRAPDQAALARGMLEAAADQVVARAGLASGPYGEPPLPGPKLDALYRDAGQRATDHPAEIPDGLIQAAVQAASKIQFNVALAERFLGCWLTEPNQAAVFDSYYSDVDDDVREATKGNKTDDTVENSRETPYTHWALDRRTRMLYRGKRLFINGEVAPVTAEPGLKILANARELSGANPAAQRLTPEAVDTLTEWLTAGWIHLVRR
jgi:50S ribosomal protein L16 3-hydroxylase